MTTEMTMFDLYVPISQTEPVERIATLEAERDAALARVADAERRADVSEQALADLACGHGVVTEHRAVLERVADLEAANAALRKERDHLLRQVQLALGATFVERKTMTRVPDDTIIIGPPGGSTTCEHMLSREPHVGADGECLICRMTARIAVLEAASAEAFARWYFIDCQGHDLGTAEKWLGRFRERRDG
jgi:hypothetical protein